MHCNYSSTFVEEQASLFPHHFPLSWVKSCLFCFFTAVFTVLAAIFFQPFSNLVLKILPRKKEVKMPAKRKVVGLWPRFYATTWLLCHRLQGHIFSYRKKQRHRYIFCHIVRMRATSIASDDNARQSYFYVVSRWANNNNTIFSSYCMREQASKQWPRGIVKSKPVHVVLRWANNLLSFAREAKYYLHVISQQATATSIFFTPYPKKMMTQLHARACLSLRRRDNITVGSSCTAGVQRQWFDHC